MGPAKGRHGSARGRHNSSSGHGALPAADEGTNTRRVPTTSHPPTTPKDPRSSSLELLDPSTSRRFNEHEASINFEVTSSDTGSKFRDLARRANQKPGLSQNLSDFLGLGGAAECAAYYKQHPWILRENADSLRELAVRVLRTGATTNARTIAERWLMLSRVQRMGLTADAAGEWLERVEHEDNSRVGFEKDVDDLIVVLRHAEDGAQSDSTTMRTTPAATTTAPSRLDGLRSSTATMPINIRRSSALLPVPSTDNFSCSPIIGSSRASGFDLRGNMGMEQSAPLADRMPGSSPIAHITRGYSTTASGLGMSPSATYLNPRPPQEYSAFPPSEPHFRSPPGSTGRREHGARSTAQELHETASDVLSDETIESGMMTLRVGEPKLNKDVRGMGPHLTLLRGYDQQKMVELDRSYQIRLGKQAKSFFVRGRVFGMVWHENAGSGMEPNQTEVSEKLDRPFHTFTLSKDNVRIFSHIRRFVVVKARHGYCWAIPINSYGNKGLLDKKFSEDEQRAHTIVHSNQELPRAVKNEPKFTKKPIAVKMAPGERLTPTSRLHFDKPQSIDWNVRVKDIGMIQGEPHARRLITYFRYEFNKGDDTTASEGEEE